MARKPKVPSSAVVGAEGDEEEPQFVHNRTVTGPDGRALEEYTHKWGSGFHNVRIRERDAEKRADKLKIKPGKRSRTPYERFERPGGPGKARLSKKEDPRYQRNPHEPIKVP